MPGKLKRILLITMIGFYAGALALLTYGNWLAEGEDHNFWNHLLNALILSIPLVLFCGSIYVLVTAWWEHRQVGEISPRLAKIIHLVPRIAAAAIIFFVTLFSLDVFGGEEPFLQQLGAFFIHSLPSIVMILLLVIAWNRPVVGFAAFLLAGIFFLRFVLAGRFDPVNFLLFSGPLLLISALFYIDWRWNRPKLPLTGKAGGPV